MHTFFFFQAEDGIRDHAQSRGLGDVYKRQPLYMVGYQSHITYTPTYTDVSFQNQSQVKGKKQCLLANLDLNSTKVEGNNLAIGSLSLKNLPQLIALLLLSAVQQPSNLSLIHI
eukprot:TRINITY_DN4340_c0_g1_i6.p3 TRINITY_DN4340_c0_g1~~TRINITY_DN4340_c0_g1_i6.p3  ORF type:complete len:114 (+),score=5.63 TRINITY_DN4340_c0_g1_i6:24-365(+)